jgi:putative effector of murein hydrolase LrgA (UPF0299 family)
MLGFFALLLVCQLAGEVAVVATGIPVPGPVVGMAILFIGLMIRGRIPRALGETADALLSHLSLLFVPAGVGVMLHAKLIGAEVVPITVSLIASTVLTIAVTAVVMRLLSRKGEMR